MSFDSHYKDKKILVTGHTGFKGSWMCKWLTMLGAKVYGYALDPAPETTFYDALDISNSLEEDIRADLRDYSTLKKTMLDVNPDYVFHLAAQPLVRLSYEIPVETFEVNVMGSVHVMEAIRETGITCNVVMVTTDKCYENKEWIHSYREEDAMGGYDPYSASKGAAELVISSYRNSYFNTKDSKVKIASARAGNVIGGGDWALDRIVPDCVRSIQQNQTICVRNKIATRPWQHVLEPISGYLWLGAVMDKPALQGREASDLYTSGFNFGPALTSNKTVEDLVVEFLKYYPGEWADCSEPSAVHEASKLNLAIDKAFHLLEWSPVWDFSTTISKTASWYREVGAETNDAVKHYTEQQIRAYTQDAYSKGVRWSKQPTI